MLHVTHTVEEVLKARIFAIACRGRRVAARIEAKESDEDGMLRRGLDIRYPLCGHLAEKRKTVMPNTSTQQSTAHAGRPKI